MCMGAYMSGVVSDSVCVCVWVDACTTNVFFKKGKYKVLFKRIITVLPVYIYFFFLMNVEDFRPFPQASFHLTIL